MSSKTLWLLSRLGRRHERPYNYAKDLWHFNPEKEKAFSMQWTDNFLQQLMLLAHATSVAPAAGFSGSRVCDYRFDPNWGQWFLEGEKGKLKCAWIVSRAVALCGADDVACPSNNPSTWKNAQLWEGPICTHTLLVVLAKYPFSYYDDVQ